MMNLFLLLSNHESLYKSMPFYHCQKKPQNYQVQILHYSQDQNNVVKNDASATGNTMYLQSPNYKSIKGLCNFQNYVEIYAH